MDNALGEPQTIVLLGGTSEIGLAIVRELLCPSTCAIVLGCRDVVAGERAAKELRTDAIAVEVVAFDAAEPAAHQAMIDGIGARHGGGDGAVISRDAMAAAELAAVDFTGAVTVTVAAANLLRAQGHGAIVVLSSVAGERVRPANPVYGGCKAGLDGFAQGLGDLVAAEGVHVLVVRPGFVHTAMTAGLKPAPFATTPEKVAVVTVAGLRNRRRIVWAPGVLRYVFSVLRHVPAPVWRRLPLG